MSDEHREHILTLTMQDIVDSKVTSDVLYLATLLINLRI